MLPEKKYDFSQLQAAFGDQLRLEEPLARYTVARLGGAAAALIRAKTTENLIEAVTFAQEHQIPWFILGGGANVLISDAGFRGLVIINDTHQVNIEAETGLVTADSGANLTTLARRCMALGLKGLEWAVSVPGTIGGAVVNNAGAHGGDMAHNLLEAQVLTLPAQPPVLERVTLSTQDLEYAYRHSKLKGQRGRYVVLSATLKLEPGHSPAELNQTADGFIAHRKKTQPPGASLGSMFKNPPGDYAGRLIEAAGLKGTQIGGVQISPVHANFFVNVGGGTASDYRALIELAQKTVAAQLGINLELEVEFLGD